MQENTSSDMDKRTNMGLVTVFTPTYNRANTIVRVFESLKKQTDMRFCWLIVDDGSTDETEQLVGSWIENVYDFEIRYIKKNNGGLHTGYNVAIENSRTELMVCIDSDDYMPNDAIELILGHWGKYGADEYAGIIGLDFYHDTNSIVGDPLPKQLSVNLIDLLIGKYKIRNGDRKLVVRTELYRSVAPMRSFPGEKSFNPHYMHLLISQSHDFLVLNKNLCYVEYQHDGMTNSIIKQYYSSPNSYLECRKLNLSLNGTSIAFRLRQCIHYISSCILSKRYSDMTKNVTSRWILMLAFPFGVMLSIWIRLNGKSDKEESL